jgi:hypothetical protein
MKIGSSVRAETHRKLWFLAQLMDTTMGDALDRLVAQIDPEAGQLPAGLLLPASPDQLKLSA